MENTIKKVYVVHHSHTDIGYTDLQERVIQNQVNYIRTVLQMMKQEVYQDFRWNCETLFCVEEFFKQATEQEAEEFFKLVQDNKVGLSANYLNFNDIADSTVYHQRLQEWKDCFAGKGISMRTAMIADINGISMGQRDALIDSGVEFLYTNIHCHHGMYPLYQNQNAYFWENANGKKLLVWNGEHYNLGNVLGLKPNRTANFMMQNHLGKDSQPKSAVETLHDNLTQYLALCVENGYPYDFIITSVSGVFSDNAPPEPEILETIQAYTKAYGQEVEVRMVSLQELYEEIRGSLQDSPVLHGDLTDWWAHGAGSTPYAVKHYRDAQYRYHLCHRLDPDIQKETPALVRQAQDNLLLYAEHTWGHSSTVTNPYDTMVLNLDMRKNGYASKAHEATSIMLNSIAEKNGDLMRYYHTNGKIRVCNTNQLTEPQLVEFYIESPVLAAAKIVREDGVEIPCQVSPHPRGRKISFVDSFGPMEKKEYQYSETTAPDSRLNSRKAYVGSERIRDIVNDYDPISYKLPYEFENQWFLLKYRPKDGVTAFVDKRTGKNLLPADGHPLFTPMYERTKVDIEYPDGGSKEEQARRILGRNIRGENAELFTGELQKITCCERGEVFALLKLEYALEGSVHAAVFVKLFNEIPRIDFTLQLGKTISSDIESVFLPLTMEFEDAGLYLRKGGEAFRPGMDQLPGTCMEYYISDEGMAYVSDKGGALVAFRDTPLVYMGEMRHHPILLCDGKEENNKRPVYSWLMNNLWETNFKMDLSGFCEYNYSLWLTEEQDGEKAMDLLKEKYFAPYVLIVG